jgi:hypothetical protein
MARGGARVGAGRPARKSAHIPLPRARARGGSENQRPWPADKVERWSGPLLRLGPARGHHDRDLGDAELPGSENPGVARKSGRRPRPPTPASSSPTP